MTNFTTFGWVMNVSLVVLTIVGAYLAVDLYSKRLLARGERRQYFVGTPIADGLLKRTQIRLDILDVKTSAYDFTVKVIIQSIVIGTVIFVASIFALPMFLTLGLTLITVFLSMVIPFYNLDRTVTTSEAQREFDLPRYFKMLIALLKRKTSYQAIVESVEYAPNSIKPFVEQLIIEIEQMPNSSTPYENFADNIGIEQARNFMTILHQSMHVSPEKSIEFLENLKTQSNKLENAAIETLASISVSTMSKYGGILLVCLLITPITIVVLIAVDLLKEFL